MEINERDFFKNPLNRNEIEGLLGDKPASEMFNFKSPSFKKLGIEKDKLVDEDLISLILQEPRFIRRPVVRIGSDVYFSADQPVLGKLFV